MSCCYVKTRRASLLFMAIAVTDFFVVVSFFIQYKPVPSWHFQLWLRIIQSWDSDSESTYWMIQSQIIDLFDTPIYMRMEFLTEFHTGLIQYWWVRLSKLSYTNVTLMFEQLKIFKLELIKRYIVTCNA